MEFEVFFFFPMLKLGVGARLHLRSLLVSLPFAKA